MPGMYNGMATEYTENTFKMEAYLRTLDPGGEGGDVLRAAATEAKDMDDDEVENLAAICSECVSTQQRVGSMLDHHDQATSARLLVECWPQSVAGAEQMVPTSISFHRRHHRAIERQVDGLGTPSGRTRGKTQRVRPRFRRGRSTEEDDDSRHGRTTHRRPQDVP